MPVPRYLNLAIVIILFLWPTAADAQAEGPTYVVQEGDTLFGIAFIFGSTVNEVAAANGIENPSAIFPGQELVIPGLEGIQGSLRFEVLEFGETLTSRALRHGLPLDQLVQLNRVLLPQRFPAGQRVVLVEPEAPELPLPTAQRVMAARGDSLLELSARLNSDPWSIQAYNRLGARRWSVAVEMLYAPGGDSPTTALPPELDAVEVGPLPSVQGQVVVIQVTAPEGTQVSGRLGPWNLNLVERAPGDFVALQGVHALSEPGLLELEIGQLSGSMFSQPIELVEGDYGREVLQVPPETLDPENTGPEDELIGRVVGQITPEMQWEGVFAFPGSYYETFPSFFGTRRSYNGSEFIYYHTGLDLYGGSTTPVLAPAIGRVAFADNLTVRGNVTYLDHGGGVYSGFLHQSQILVQVGDPVEQGQIIGYVGGTGRVTGPHLHWEVWVGGVPVDPLLWTRTPFP